MFGLQIAAGGWYTGWHESPTGWNSGLTGAPKFHYTRCYVTSGAQGKASLFEWLTKNVGVHAVVEVALREDRSRPVFGVMD